MSVNNPHRFAGPKMPVEIRLEQGPSYFPLDTKKISAEVNKQSTLALDEYCGFQTKAAYRDDYRNLDGNTSGRPGLTNSDYFAFRPEEAPPGSISELTYHCNLAYRKVGVIRNIIDLMGDFASKGIRLVCKNKKEQAIYNKWWNAVNGEERSERFANTFYRLGTVVVRKINGRATLKVRRMLNKTEGKTADTVINTDENQTINIPWRYVILDPGLIKPIGGQLASFVGKPMYAINLPMSLKKIINSPSNEEERVMVKELPEDIKKAAKENKPYPLPPDKIEVYFYKKDDWMPWGSPMLEAVLKDTKLLEKLKLADMAALDGAISNIRIFKLGSLQTTPPIAPTAGAARKLAQILQNNVGGGTFDIIWGPDIELIESKTAVHQFLGEEKYKPTLNAIFMALGIPPTVTGTFGASGTTNNFISLKTLIERLEYGRKALKSFWEKEAEDVRKALGLKSKAIVEFDYSNLGDEANEKTLWISLYDRGLVSDEMMRYIFKTNNEMEDYRLMKEHQERKSGKRLPKAGAFNNPESELDLRKIALQNGYITPEQADVQIKEGVKDQETPFDIEIKVQKEGIKKQKEAQQLAGKPKGPMKTKKKGVPGQGRPKNSNDKQQRKKKSFKPRTRASLEVWTSNTQDIITNKINPFLLEYFNHKNMRQLTEEEFAYAEKIKFGVLGNIAPHSEVTDELILNALQMPIDNELWNEFSNTVKAVKNKLKRVLSSEEERRIQACIYIEYKGE